MGPGSTGNCLILRLKPELIREARKSALVMVLCDVLPDVPVAELYKAA